MEEPLETFQRGLGARIDALEMAMQAAVGGDSDAGETVHRMARTVSEQAAELDLITIREAAQRVSSASEARLPRETKALIAAMRAKAGSHRILESHVLVVGGTDELFDSLSARLAAADRVFLRAHGGEDADRLLKQHHVACMVLHLALPDIDGRMLLIRLRENPMTANIPVLILGGRIDELLKEDSLLQPTDDYMEGRPDLDAVTNWLAMRLRRGPESNKPARRDTLTGLMNRASFRETFDQIRDFCQSTREPLALANISLRASQPMLGKLDEYEREALLRQFGQRLATSLRATDTVARWGIYEFAILLPGEDLPGGTCAVQKIVAAVADQPLRQSDGDTLNLAIAVGISAVAPEQALDDVMAETERLAFESATRGGNEIVSAASAAAPRKPRRVLLLVRDAVTIRILGQILEKEHLEVTAFSQWDDEARACLRDTRFQLVLIDELLPPDGGLEVLKELREAPANNRLPISVLVTRNDEASIARALDLGANDYMTRPFAPLTFVTRIRRLMSRGASNGRGDGGLRLLIVEENVQSLIMAATALHQRGHFDIYLARHADDAVARMGNFDPQAILFEPSLATGDGTPLLDLLRRRGIDADILLALAPVPAGAPTPRFPRASRDA